MHWSELRPGIWATTTAPTRAMDLPALRASLEALIDAQEASLPIDIVFDVTGPVEPFGTEVVQGYLQILARHRKGLGRIYVASDNAMVRFAGCTSTTRWRSPSAPSIASLCIVENPLERGAITALSCAGRAAVEGRRSSVHADAGDAAARDRRGRLRRRGRRMTLPRPGGQHLRVATSAVENRERREEHREGA